MEARWDRDAARADPPTLDAVAEHLRREGYAKVRLEPGDWALGRGSAALDERDVGFPDVGFPDLAACVRAVEAAGWPEVTAMAFDELWLLVRRARPVVARILGEDHLMMSEVFLFHLRAGGQRYGWGPHRDRSWTRGYRPLDASGRPSSINVWFPLTDADADNGCIYLVPKPRDPNYRASEEEHRRDPAVEQAFGRSLDAANILLQDVRAVPTTPGQLLLWDGELLHWGSHAKEGSAPRISLAVEWMRNDAYAKSGYALPLFAQERPGFGLLWPLRKRLGFVSMMVVDLYRHMLSVPPGLDAMLREVKTVGGWGELDVDAERGGESEAEALEAERSERVTFRVPPVP